MQIPFICNAGAWNIKLLPEPVARITKQALFSFIYFIGSFCSFLNLSKPNNFNTSLLLFNGFEYVLCSKKKDADSSVECFFCSILVLKRLFCCLYLVMNFVIASLPNTENTSLLLILSKNNRCELCTLSSGLELLFFIPFRIRN